MSQNRKIRNVIQEVEQPFIGILLAEGEEALRVADKFRIRPAHFLEPRYAAIYTAACAVRNAGQEVTMAAIWNQLAPCRDRFQFGAHEIATMAAEALPAVNAVTFAEDIINESRRRTVMEALNRGVALILEGEDPAGTLRDVMDGLNGVTAGIFAEELPPIVTVSQLEAENPEPPPELIYGVLHQGGKLMLGGTSKSNKTWVLLDLAISIAHHEPWLNFKTSRGKVLFVNLEVQKWALLRRINNIVSAKHLNACNDNLHLWNLRGNSASFENLLPKIIKRTKSDAYSLVILDPIYKLYGGTDENSAGDVANLLNGLERITTETGAAIAFSAHFAKGNAAGKDSIDRVSGSGVFARDPDAILTMTPHETPDAFTVESTLRNFKPVPPFVIRWQVPLMRVDEDLDPTKLRQIGGRKKEYDVDAILGLLDKPMRSCEWQQRATEETGVSRRKFYQIKAHLLEVGLVTSSDDKWTKTIGVQNGAERCIN